MKTTIEIHSASDGKKDKTYPCLKQSITQRGRIVLFIAPGAGTAITESGQLSGDSHSCWAEEMFEVFDGSITLTSVP